MGLSDRLAYAEALHHAALAREPLDAQAALAKLGACASMPGIRDLIMADNLEHFLALGRDRSQVLVFAASGHLKRGWRSGACLRSLASRNGGRRARN